MSLLAGPFFAAVALLAVAGIAKVTSPDPTRVALRSAGLPSSVAAARLLGVTEVAIAAAALVGGGAVAALAVAAAYLGFAGFSALVRRRTQGRASCGCFGASQAPLGRVHVAVDLALAAVALVVATDPIGGLWTVASDTPWGGVPFLALTALAAWLVQLTLTALPELWAAQHPPAPDPATTAPVRLAPRATS